MTLANYIDRHRKVPFSYGRMDCALFAFGWVKEKTGRDLLADLPKWETERDTLRILRDLGGMEKAVDARLTPINPHMAQDGDVGMVNGLLCLYTGAHLVGPDKGGLTFFNRMLATAAWRVE